MKWISRYGLIVIFALAWLLGAGPRPAAAHPLGNFSVNLYSHLRAEPHSLRVSYVVDMAEIPTFQEMEDIDSNGDGSASAPERARYSSRRSEQLVSGLIARVDGGRVALRVISSSVTVRPGQAGLATLRLEATMAGPIGERGRIEFRDLNYPDRLGWREITAAGADGEAVEGSSVPAVSVTSALRRYPSDLLSNPLRVTRAVFTVGPGASNSGQAGGAEVSAAPSGGAGFAGLATWSGLSLPVLAAALLLAAGWGAAHALLPGHGKTIMAAYLVGSGGKIRHAVAVGVAVALMHTVAVVGVGLAILAAGRVTSPERIYPWLTLVSGSVVIALGGWLLAARLRTPRGRGHEHEHGHPHIESSRGRLGALAISGGLLPSPTALLVLLSTAAAHRVVFGISLILAFSVGLAATLAGIGILALRAREFVLPRLHGGLARLIPVLTAAAMVGVGVILTGRGLIQL